MNLLMQISSAITISLFSVTATHTLAVSDSCKPMTAILADGQVERILAMTKDFPSQPIEEIFWKNDFSNNGNRGRAIETIVIREADLKFLDGVIRAKAEPIEAGQIPGRNTKDRAYGFQLVLAYTIYRLGQINKTDIKHPVSLEELKSLWRDLCIIERSIQTQNAMTFSVKLDETKKLWDEKLAPIFVNMANHDNRQTVIEFTESVSNSLSLADLQNSRVESGVTDPQRPH